jgi:hypothetical protein
MKIREKIFGLATVFFVFVAMGIVSPCFAQPLTADIDIKQQPIRSALLQIFNKIKSTLEKPLKADIDIKPEVLKPFCTMGTSVTITVEPPEGYSAADIAIGSVMISKIGGIGSTIAPTSSQIISDDDCDNDDCDDDQADDTKLVLTFSCSDVLKVINGNTLTGEVKITVSGTLTNGKAFADLEEVLVEVISDGGCDDGDCDDDDCDDDDCDDDDCDDDDCDDDQGDDD